VTKAQTLLMVTLLLVAAVLATAGVVGWSSRRALLAETEAQGLVIARLLARSAAVGAHVMSDVHLVREMMDELKYRLENDKILLVLKTRVRET